MMDAEKEDEKDTDDIVMKEEPKPQNKLAAGGSSMFNKLRNTTDEEAKAKLKSTFKGLPI